MLGMCEVVINRMQETTASNGRSSSLNLVELERPPLTRATTLNSCSIRRKVKNSVNVFTRLIALLTIPVTEPRQFTLMTQPELIEGD